MKWCSCTDDGSQKQKHTKIKMVEVRHSDPEGEKKMKIKALTRVQKFVKENNIPVFNMGEMLQSGYDKKGGNIVVQPKETLRVVFNDAIYSDGKQMYSIVWFDPTKANQEGGEVNFEKCKTQKEMIEKYMEIAGVEEIEEVVVEKSAVIPMESPVKITPEVTAMNVSRESESARQLVKMMQLDNKEEPTVLDYGCGLGRNMLYMKKETENKNIFAYIHGTDTDEQIKNIENSSNYNKLNPMVGRLKIYDNEYLKINNSKYDYILSSHVLNVVMDDVKKIIIEDMYRHLKIGGKAVIQVRTESDVASAKTKEKYGDGWLIKKGKDTTYQEGITKEKMHKLLTDAGFKIINHRFTKSIHMVEVIK